MLGNGGFDRGAQRRLGHRRHEAHLGHLLRNQLCGLREGPAQIADLSPPATRYHRDHGLRAAQAQATAHRLRIGIRVERIRERVTDEIRRHPIARVERRLEREQTEDPVDRPRNRLHPGTSPGPNRGADDVDRADAGVAQSPLQTEIEIRRVDPDHHIGAVPE